jgi:hypothetical protein
MKKFIGIISTLIVLVMTAPVFGGDDFPKFKILDTDKQSVNFIIPLSSEQLEKENIKDPVWQVFVSIAFHEKNEWIVDRTNYALKTEQEGNYLRAKKTFSDFGDGQFWLRIWYRDKISGKWGWIDTSSEFCLTNEKNKPSYEALVNANSGISRPVPINFHIRR